MSRGNSDAKLAVMTAAEKPDFTLSLPFSFIKQMSAELLYVLQIESYAYALSRGTISVEFLMRSTTYFFPAIFKERATSPFIQMNEWLDALLIIANSQQQPHPNIRKFIEIVFPLFRFSAVQN